MFEKEQILIAIQKINDGIINLKLDVNSMKTDMLNIRKDLSGIKLKMYNISKTAMLVCFPGIFIGFIFLVIIKIFN
jgi:hypothetical protein